MQAKGLGVGVEDPPSTAAESYRRVRIVDTLLPEGGRVDPQKEGKPCEERGERKDSGIVSALSLFSAVKRF